ncbi:sigma factor-like helix-turn-helix DNA-binding protein [Streptomyces sp. NPDC050658]|uniref:sigma factor-like helix-turn-helix DNA-binding protein n=1 Tax=unclassified Streptomyces TaxID=2593676 RepID=UPI00341EE885
MLHRTPSGPPLDTSGTTTGARPAAPVTFDALYVSAAPALVQQAYVLTGCRRLAFESAEQAFHRAWERWPEVARDPDPAGWVRAQAHEYALSPWHRFRHVPTRPRPLPADTFHRVLLELPPWQRRAVLLCDGLGLSVTEAATETEATTAATDSRLRHAREVLTLLQPDAPHDTLKTRIKSASAATIAQPWSVRASAERRARVCTRVVFAATATLIGLVTVTIATTPARAEPADSHGPRHQSALTEPQFTLLAERRFSRPESARPDGSAPPRRCAAP